MDKNINEGSNDWPRNMMGDCTAEQNVLANLASCELWDKRFSC